MFFTELKEVWNCEATGSVFDDLVCSVVVVLGLLGQDVQNGKGEFLLRPFWGRC